MSMKTRFNAMAKKAAYAAGTPWAFGTAALAVVLWGCSGPVFGFNDTWQLVINTSTTIITFLMVFLIQHTQNADTAAMQIKIDELINATRGANNALLDLEELDEQALEALRKKYEELAREARNRMGRTRSDTT
ncbi:low affinity iron permease family protein [Pseudoxanthomonas winnipegensis]|uniref:low affinity iron permease family protein n=1 Tax=Pseudoxanthomonas winnipegensis TaxID=2480810 RepID=UPI00103B03DB|nr:low affinity iron permease family protein [Pseudoxanthomonas winnipegensis]TBV71999.1 low affinity iron permease family protein [Pseudoxanthomonas winnipegensis]